MKVTAQEELESYKAMRHKECCANCGGAFYTIHHQIFPREIWWVACDECGYESDEELTKNLALAQWRNRQ